MAKTLPEFYEMITISNSRRILYRHIRAEDFFFRPLYQLRLIRYFAATGLPSHATGIAEFRLAVTFDMIAARAQLDKPIAPGTCLPAVGECQLSRLAQLRILGTVTVLTVLVLVVKSALANATCASATDRAHSRSSSSSSSAVNPCRPEEFPTQPIAAIHPIDSDELAARALERLALFRCHVSLDEFRVDWFRAAPWRKQCFVVCSTHEKRFRTVDAILMFTFKLYAGTARPALIADTANNNLFRWRGRQAALTVGGGHWRASLVIIVLEWNVVGSERSLSAGRYSCCQDYI